MIVLSPQEREKFAAWLEQDAASDVAIIQQMEKLRGIGPEMLRHRRAQVMMKRWVAEFLRSIESQTIGEETGGQT